MNIGISSVYQLINFRRSKSPVLNALSLLRSRVEVSYKSFSYAKTCFSVVCFCSASLSLFNCSITQTGIFILDSFTIALVLK